MVCWIQNRGGVGQLKRENLLEKRSSISPLYPGLHLQVLPSALEAVDGLSWQEKQASKLPNARRSRIASFETLLGYPTYCHRIQRLKQGHCKEGSRIPCLDVGA